MTKRFIAGLISLILIISAIPVMAASIGEELYGKIAETVIIEPDNEKMIKYGRVEKLTENNVGVAYYADETLVVPIRFLAETFYGQIDYDNISRKCRVSFERKVFEYQIGSKTIKVGDEEKELSLPPFLNDGTTYVPLLDFITPMGMSYITGDNGITVISPIDSMDKPYFTDAVFDKLHDVLNASPAPEVTLYVSTKGSAEGDGTRENPLDSIYTARDYIREMKKDGVERKYTVLFEEGIYSLDKTVEFEPQDSGTPSNPIEYAAVPGANVKFTSGYMLDTWEKYDENIYRVQLPEPQKDCWLLSEGAKIATKAKYPNEGYLQMIGDTPSLTVKSFHYDELPDINVKPDLMIGFYPGGKTGQWMWTWWYRYVVEFDKVNKRIVMNDGTFDGNPSYNLGTKTKYIVYNALELIDIPGEQYYDAASNYLYYYPYDANNLKDVIIPRPMDMLEFDGESTDMRVRNISLDGIHFDALDFYADEFYQDNFDLKKNGYISYEMTGVAIKQNYTSGIHFSGCRFTKIGYQVFKGSEAVYTNVENCTFQEIGDRAYTTGKFSNIENCFFDNSGFVTLTACSIMVNAPYSRVANNRITNMRRSGIQVNGKTTGSVIEYNELDNCMWSSQDGAAIYMNALHGGVMRNNIMRDIETNYGVITALYIDDDSEDFKAYNNQIYNMYINSYYKGEYYAGVSQKSQRNEVYNNVFADLGVAHGFTFNKQPWDTIKGHYNYNNVWYNCYDRHRQTFTTYSTIYLSDELFKKLGGNMFWNEIGSYEFSVLGLDEQADFKNLTDGDLGHKELIGVKPEFMNEAERDYRMRYDSMAYAQGFRDTNISDIGLKEDFKFGPEEKVLDRLHMKEKGSFTDKATILLATGESKQLELSAREEQMQIKFKPDMKYITFTSDNTDAVTVSADGVIKGIGFGKAHIVATYDDGKVRKSTDVYVFVDDFAVAEYISPEQTTELYVAESENFGTVPFIYAKTKLGRVLELNTDIHKFESANDETAIVKKNGKIIGKKIGETEITLASAVKDAKVEPYKIKINTIKDFYTVLRAESSHTILSVGEKVEVQTVGLAKRNREFEEIPTTLTSADEGIVKIVEEDGKRYIEAVGEGSAVVTVAYDSVPNNQITKKATYSVVGKDSNYSGLNFKEISGGTMESGVKSIKDGHFSFFTSGKDVYSFNDEFSYLYKEVEGDVDVEVTIDAIENKVDVSTSIGPMIRISTETGAYMVQYRIRADGLLLAVWRNEKNPGCTHTTSVTVDLPATLKLERKGDTFNCYVKQDDAWSRLMSCEVEMPKSVVAGVGAFSHSDTKTSDFELSDLKITEKGGSAEK